MSKCVMQIKTIIAGFAVLGAFAVPATAEVVRAVEYYHQSFEHYFVTANPAEIAALDSGAFDGWWRTGQRYRVDAAPAEGLVPVCRFYTAAYAGKGSHFFTALASECAHVKAMPDWTYEGVAFYARLPDAAGNCAAGTAPVKRLFNGGQGGAPNHAYTADSAKRDKLIAAGWVFEGVAYCVPLAAGDPSAMTQLLAGSNWHFAYSKYYFEAFVQFDPVPIVNGAAEEIARWGFPKPSDAIYSHVNSGNGFTYWDAVAAWDPLSGEYLVLRDISWDVVQASAITFDNAQSINQPICAMTVKENFERLRPVLHSFQPTLMSGCAAPGNAYRLGP